MDQQPFTPAGNTVNLAVTAATGRVALTRAPLTFPELTIVLFNAGTSTVFVKFGDVTVVAAASTSHPIEAGATAVFSVPNTAVPYVAAITGSGTATLYATSGTGIPYGFGGGSATGSGGASAVTIADGADVALGSTTDAAYTGTQPYTAMSALRAIANAAISTAGTVVVGNVASGAADSGNPVKTGGVYTASGVSLSDGQRGNMALSVRSALTVAPTFDAQSPGDGGSLGTTAPSAITAAGTVLYQGVRPQIYNGSTYDKTRSVITGTDSIGTGIAAAGILGQFDDASTTTVTENQFANVRISADRSLLTTEQNSFNHISTATTTTVKSGAGTLASISVNSLGTVASACTVYDSTTGSGTVIGVINTLALSGIFMRGIKFSTGLTLVTTGTVAPDITVSYK